MTTRKQCLLDTTDKLTRGRTVFVTASTRPVQAQVRPDPNMEREMEHEIPSLT